MAIIFKPTINGEKKYWYVKYKHQGKWKKESLKVTNKKVADGLLKDYIKAEEEGRTDKIHRTPISLLEFLPRHLEHSKMTNSPKWYRDKCYFLNNQITPVIGGNTLGGFNSQVQFL